MAFLEVIGSKVFHVIFVLLGSLICSASCQLEFAKYDPGFENNLDGVYIEDCREGRYFWKESNPFEFFVCIESNARGRPPSMNGNNAVRLVCPAGTFVCNKKVQQNSSHLNQFFWPCICHKEVQYPFKENPDEGVTSNDPSDVTQNDPSDVTSNEPEELFSSDSPVEPGILSVTAVLNLINTTGDLTSEMFFKSGSSSTGSDEKSGSLWVDSTDPEIGLSSFNFQSKIPDTGCPFIYRKFADKSHPFGLNVTSHKFHRNQSPEECKLWCLLRPFCRGVDFNLITSTCYYLREIQDGLLVNAPGVLHFQKTQCSPPLICWYTPLRVIARMDDTSVTDIHTPSVECHGVCFVRQTSESSTVIERGCRGKLESPASGAKLGCFVDGTPSTNFQTITCYCDTNRCNGLSVEALASQMLYLPLDGDIRDHSGLDRQVVVPTGATKPTFTCLDKSTNCSAVFLGGECLSVNSLVETTFQSLEAIYRTDIPTASSRTTLSFIPTASFVVSYKRVPTGAPQKQGVFGNSGSSSTLATWAITADNMTDTSTAGVITDNTRLQTTEDYKYSVATDNAWHQHVLTYNGEGRPLPTLQYFVDGQEMVGNARLESGNISIRNQPVTLGCVEGRNFVGFIDEARIFSINLDEMDIKALLAMRDSNY